MLATVLASRMEDGVPEEDPMPSAKFTERRPCTCQRDAGGRRTGLGITCKRGAVERKALARLLRTQWEAQSPANAASQQYLACSGESQGREVRGLRQQQSSAATQNLKRLTTIGDGSKLSSPAVRGDEECEEFLGANFLLSLAMVVQQAFQPAGLANSLRAGGLIRRRLPDMPAHLIGRPSEQRVRWLGSSCYRTRRRQTLFHMQNCLPLRTRQRAIAAGACVLPWPCCSLTPFLEHVARGFLLHAQM